MAPPPCCDFYKGQEVEVRSNLSGYRGAWFRCKIQDIDLVKDGRMKEGRLKYLLKYLDYEEEEDHWTLEYQIIPFLSRKPTKKHLQHMIRPMPPPFLREDKFFQSSFKEAITISKDWKVGDQVDWWTSGCWWQCTIRKLIGKDTIEIALLERPYGEGGIYIALKSYLRPSLKWSKENSWEYVTFEQGRKRSREIYEREIFGDKSVKQKNLRGVIPKWSNLRELIQKAV
ncbi:uncharacterized protein LOC9637229 isoform X2 [Selaginella moellendorffii]|uniref:uncharacterized protein LOC9637229 isoform X2 n=1 Tax=Selaginella moellendorffii TaxID=88036 RepID=UPI000D1C559B|nr:uncharacterized protein LOC9637229 isoform X2 [Selaginella moellendorffii]|eukprot:XP_024535397.1 uncharacterized protein LOC9637229 isoform X2 [Selaginella moellendorffii]